MAAATYPSLKNRPGKCHDGTQIRESRFSFLTLCLRAKGVCSAVLTATRTVLETYRCYQIDVLTRGFFDTVSFEARDDGEAIAMAERILKQRRWSELELWQSSRMVTTLSE
jgi:hypothetical protein